MLKDNENSWPITANRYVAFIDIMGFKDLVMRSSHHEIYKIMKDIDLSTKMSSSVEWDGKSNLVTTTTYSDSIILYSKNHSYDSLIALTCTVSALIHDLFLKGIPFKGACAFGKMTLDTKKSIFFGQPLIDAYLLQEEVNFYGIVAHATFEEKVDFFRNKKKSVSFVETYSCKFKNGNSKHLTIYPILLTSIEDEYKERIDKLFHSVEKLRYKTSGHIRKYIDETESYLKKIKEDRELVIERTTHNSR